MRFDSPPSYMHCSVWALAAITLLKWPKAGFRFVLFVLFIFVWQILYLCWVIEGLEVLFLYFLLWVL